VGIVETDDAVYGMSSSKLGRILLSKELSPDQMRETLIHEVLHAIWKQTSLVDRYPDQDEDSEGEKIIKDLSPRIYQWIMDNPEVIEWLASA
jgi:hypothetical protein